MGNPGCRRAGDFFYHVEVFLQKKRVICYVDGFNLYHAIDGLRPRNDSLKWLNLWALPSAFIKRSQEQVVGVYYFTAYAKWLTNAVSRHKKYVKALEHLGVTPVFGNFKRKTKRCHDCGSVWTAHEEKRSDVNIAAYLIHHAHLGRFDKALIISADSDLCHALELIMEAKKDLEFKVLIPPFRNQNISEFKEVVPTQKIKFRHIKNNLLPKEIIDDSGNVVVVRPKEYAPLALDQKRAEK